jgi:hypothetical protein
MIESPVRERPTRERAKPRATKRVETHRPVVEAPTGVLERFLELPVGLVLAVLWVAGAALVGSCALVLYVAVSALI